MREGRRPRYKCYPKQAVEASRVQAVGGRPRLGHPREGLEDVMPAETLPAWTEGDREDEIREGRMTMKAKTGMPQP